MKLLIYGLIVLLCIVHQDFWYWNDSTLVFGFMPIGLAYHAGISITAAVLWALAIKYCWPGEVAKLDDASAGAQEGSRA